MSFTIQIRQANKVTLMDVRGRLTSFEGQAFRDAIQRLLRQGDNKLLATGHTIHVACNRAGHVKHFPDKYKAAFLSIAQPTP